MNKEAAISRRDMFKTAGVVAAGVTAASLLPAMKAAAARGGAPRWAMVIDLRRCTGCRGCTIACKAEYGTLLGTWKTVVQDEAMGTYPNTKKIFMSKRCNHCEGNKEDRVPPCVKVCPEYPKERQKFTLSGGGRPIRYRDGATYKRPDGLILYKNEYCTGCGKCIEACPYGARSFDKRIKAGKDSTKSGITKCSSCQHRVDKGLVPACVNICQSRARIFGDLNDPESEVSKLAKEFGLVENRDKTTLLPGENTVPMVFYVDYNDAMKSKTAQKKYEGNESFRDQSW